MEEASAGCIQVRCEVGQDAVGGGGPSQGMASPQGSLCPLCARPVTGRAGVCPSNPARRLSVTVGLSMYANLT